MPWGGGWHGLVWWGPRPVLCVERRPWLARKEEVWACSGGGGGRRHGEGGASIPVQGSPRRMPWGGEGATGSEGGRGCGERLPLGSVAVDTRVAPGERHWRWGRRDVQSGAKGGCGGVGRGKEVGDGTPGGIAPAGRGRPGPWGSRGGAELRSRRGGPPGVRGRRVGYFTSKEGFGPRTLEGPAGLEAGSLESSPCKNDSPIGEIPEEGRWETGSGGRGSWGRLLVVGARRLVGGLAWREIGEAAFYWSGRRAGGCGSRGSGEE